MPVLCLIRAPYQVKGARSPTPKLNQDKAFLFKKAMLFFKKKGTIAISSKFRI